MSNLKKAFEKGKAFIPFVTCGDPDLETTEEIVRAMERAGADVIELGIPFSDPTAEGPVVQESNVRALKRRITTDNVFEMVRRLRRDVHIPMVFKTYANVVFSYGAERFIKTCHEIGIDGLLLTDIPYEEKNEFEALCKCYEVDLISMVALTSGNRIRMIAKEAEGFLYCVSSPGVTYTKESVAKDIGTMIKHAKTEKGLPCAVGMGISTPEQARELAQVADGVIVDSSIVKLCAQYGKDSAEHIYRYVKEMKQAVL